MQPDRNKYSWRDLIWWFEQLVMLTGLFVYFSVIYGSLREQYTIAFRLWPFSISVSPMADIESQIRECEEVRAAAMYARKGH